MKNKKIYILLFTIILLGFLIISIYYPYKINQKEKIRFQVKKGDSLFNISCELRKQGIISSSFLFDIVAVISGLNNRLQSGNYELSPSMSLWNILRNLSLGKTIKKKLIIIEGWNLNNIAWYLENKGLFQAEELFEITGFPGKRTKVIDFSPDFNFLKQKPKEISLEGFLFPDTYEIEENESLKSIVKKMLANFNKKVVPIIHSQKKDLLDILIMASMLEKEVKHYRDKQIVAGILWKRLRNKWPLQVDATLTYLTGKPSSRLTKEDLKIDSRYNTYKYIGLPIGPICNPGLDSIKAAIYYKDSPYWFYLNTPKGETIFSRTLREHNINKNKFLK